MNWNPNQIRAGLQNQKEANETSVSFAAEGGGLTGPFQSADKTKKTRMAGPGGAFAQQMMRDPELAQRVSMWDQQFNQSNQGMEFNRAKVMQQAAAPQAADDQVMEQEQ